MSQFLIFFVSVLCLLEISVFFFLVLLFSVYHSIVSHVVLMRCVLLSPTFYKHDREDIVENDDEFDLESIKF